MDIFWIIIVAIIIIGVVFFSNNSSKDGCKKQSVKKAPKINFNNVDDITYDLLRDYYELDKYGNNESVQKK